MSLLEVKMSIDLVLDEYLKCGRLEFRGVEVVYLNIDGEFMLFLVELLVLVFVFLKFVVVNEIVMFFVCKE